MLVIHGIWANDALCLWAEDPRLPQVAAGPPGAGRPSRAPVPHPFAAQAGELADLLAALPGPAGAAARKAVDDELILHLPSAGDRPLASPELIRPDGDPARPGPRGRVSLARCRWSATGSGRRRGSPPTCEFTSITARTGWTATR